MSDSHDKSRRHFLSVVAGAVSVLTFGRLCAKGQSLVPDNDALHIREHLSAFGGFAVYKWTPGHSRLYLRGPPARINDILIIPGSPARIHLRKDDPVYLANGAWEDPNETAMLVRLMRAAPRGLFFRGRPTKILHIPMRVRATWRKPFPPGMEIIVNDDLYFEIDSPVSGTLVVGMEPSRECG